MSLLHVTPLLQELPVLKVVQVFTVVEEVEEVEEVVLSSLSSPPRTRGSSMAVSCIGFARQVTVLTARSLSEREREGEREGERECV